MYKKCIRIVSFFDSFIVTHFKTNSKGKCKILFGNPGGAGDFSSSTKFRRKFWRLFTNTANLRRRTSHFAGKREIPGKSGKM